MTQNKIIFQISENVLSPDAPEIYVKGLTPEETDDLWLLNWNLRKISGFADEFTHSWVLYHYAKDGVDGAVSDKWRRLATKQSIVALYNYNSALKAVCDRRQGITSILRELDNSKIEALRTEFRQRYPSLKELRQSVLHEGELYAVKQRRRENIIRGERQIGVVGMGDGAILHNGFINDVFVTTFAGDPHQHDMGSESAAELAAFTRRFFDLFREVATR